MFGGYEPTQITRHASSGLYYIFDFDNQWGLGCFLEPDNIPQFDEEPKLQGERCYEVVVRRNGKPYLEGDDPVHRWVPENVLPYMIRLVMALPQ